MDIKEVNSTLENVAKCNICDKDFANELKAEHHQIISKENIRMWKMWKDIYIDSE